ncbi:unnamed protein product [Allacma fusca]|uniref:Prenylcysteine lyase domain-containing protein n=1 Tax=Allacma fusca TaxID=39272 RepID=A0A8J2KXR8_9HEXA|nr:unnamed protein product [Allacma fusca]
MYQLNLGFCIVLTLFVRPYECDTRFSNDAGRSFPASPKIAIVGAGVGGAAVAYFLKELGHNTGIIDLYEKSNAIGGRLHTVDLYGKSYETGGSIIHPRNQYAQNLVKKLNLRKKGREPSSGFALVKDQQVVFTTSSWNVLTLMRILWRYGLGFNHLMSVTNSLIDDFSRIYSVQQKRVSYENPYELLSAMSPSLANLTRSTFKRFLKELQLKEILIEELVQAITYVNYGQNAGIHSFAGSIAIAGADDGLWSIENGNKQLPRALVQASNARLLLNANVESVTDNQNGTYGLKVTSDQKLITRHYDLVVLANPLEVSQIEFFNFTRLPYNVKDRKYHRTVATIVAGVLRENFTMAAEKVESLFTCDSSEFYTSIGRIYPVDSPGTIKADATGEKQPDYPVYKIFSPAPLTEKQLEIIFLQVHLVKVFDWKAYPEYDRVPETFPSFVLDERNLLYLNSIEWAASAIEMSLISAKNIALLISQRIDGNEPSYLSRVEDGKLIQDGDINKIEL